MAFCPNSRYYKRVLNESLERLFENSMEKNIKAVLFDIDDTLFDRNLAQVKILELIVRQFHQLFGAIEKERLVAAWEKSDLFAIADFEKGAPSDYIRGVRSRQFLRLLNISEEYFETVNTFYVQQYPLINTPVAGAIHLVNELSLKFKVGLSQIVYRTCNIGNWILSACEICFHVSSYPRSSGFESLTRGYFTVLQNYFM